MENKCIIDENGKEVWISRSVVVACVVARLTDDKRIEVLVEKRGPAVSATGRWCFPCGYLDYDETIEEGVIREVREETGYILNKRDITFIDINSKPDGKKQNVVIRHIAFIDDGYEQVERFKLDFNEVTELRWVDIGTYKSNIFVDVFNIDFEKLEEVGKWAFKHKGETIHLFEEYCKRYGIELKIKNREK
jgi:8-oxo-dGTP pyrophosphatase MutT (NUDIX family)